MKWALPATMDTFKMSLNLSSTMYVLLVWCIDLQSVKVARIAEEDHELLHAFSVYTLRMRTLFRG